MTWLVHRLLGLLGWRFEGSVPPVPKMVIIGAPHTTNWDFVLFLGALSAYRIEARYIGKHTLFRGPLGWFFTRTGGIPVDRSRPGGMVRQVAEVFEQEDEMILVVAPEGTRKAAPYWKSGFLHIAAAAAVPLVPAAVDYRGKRVALGPAIPYQGDPVAFMGKIREFLSIGNGLRPEGMGPVRIREEGT